MNKFKLRYSFLSLILVISVIAGGGLNASAEEETAPAAEEAAPAEEAVEGDAIDIEALEEMVDESELITDEEALLETKLYAETDTLELYVNEETAAFAVRVKESGFLWWSSPINADSDPLAKGAQRRTMNSPIYFNAADPVIHRTTKVNTYDAINGDGLTVEKIENGVKFSFYLEKQGTTVPLYITLEPDSSFKAFIPVSEIIEEKINASEGASMLIDASILSNLGAGGMDEDGYILVSDGSGAVINFNIGKSQSALYKGQVYGRDLSVTQLKQPAKTEQVYLPVFAIVKEADGGDKNALVAIADEGDENALVRASVLGQSTTSYNTAWFDFQLRSQDSFFMGTQNNQLYVYENGEIKSGDIAVKYYPISASDLDIADIADKYREYLINEKGLTKKTNANELPYFLTLNGGTVKLQSVMGFPANLETPATTYEEAQAIVKELTDRGIENIIINYEDFNAAGVIGYPGSGMDYSSALGGKNAYDKFAEYAGSVGAKLFPSVNFMEYYNSGGGYSFMLNSAKQLSNAISIQTPYELAFGTVGAAYTIFKSNWSVLSPYYFQDIFRKISESLTAEKVSGIAIGGTGYLLYSDFSRENPENRRYINRYDAAKTIEDGYKKLRDEGVKILAEGGNAYLLPYIDYLTNVPLYSSNFDVFDYDVPFYSMVVHGYIPYAAKANNSSSDAEDHMQMSLLTGTPLHYDMMWASPAKFNDSKYDALFYSGYEGWLDISASEYKFYKDTINDLSDQPITELNVISDAEYETRFANGKTVYINTSAGEIKINGITVSKKDYGLKGEADYVR